MNDGTEQMEAGAAEPEDVELLRRYAEGGDLEALGQLFRRHADSAYRTALRVLRSPVEAEDAVQAAFVDVLRKARNYRGGEGVRVWILRIVTSTSINMIRSAARRRRREERVVEEEGSAGLPSGGEANEETAKQAKAALDELPDKYRLPIWMHHGEGLSFQEIAGVLSISEVTLRGQVHRGLEMLRGNLGRAGVTMSGMALVTALSSLPAESAPAAVLTGIGEIVKGAGSLAPVAAAGTGALLTGTGVKVAVVAGLLAGSGALVAVYRNRENRDEVSEKNAGAVAVEKEKKHAVLAQWDFNSPGDPAGLRVIDGMWRHVPGGGADGSGCMEVLGKTFCVVTDIAVADAPLMVSFRFQPMVSGPGENPSINSAWVPWRKDAIFGNLGKTTRLTMKFSEGWYKGEWLERREYVTVRTTDAWESGERKACGIIEATDTSRLSLAVVGGVRIDDLRIERVGPEEVPDVSMFLRALEGIPEEKRVGTIPIPDIRSGQPGGGVTVTFSRPGTFPPL